jgi:hypothetical protein
MITPPTKADPKYHQPAISVLNLLTI